MKDIQTSQRPYVGFVQLHFKDKVEAHGIECAPWSLFDSKAYDSMGRLFSKRFGDDLVRIHFLDTALELQYVFMASRKAVEA